MKSTFQTKHVVSCVFLIGEVDCLLAKRKTSQIDGDCACILMLDASNT